MCVSKPYILSWNRTWCVCGGQRPIACSYSLQNCGIVQWLERVCPNCDNSGFFNVSIYICTDVGQIPEMEGPIHLETFQQVNSIGLSSTFSNKNSFRLITSQPGQISMSRSTTRASSITKYNRVASHPPLYEHNFEDYWCITVCIHPYRYLYNNYILKYCEKAWHNNDLKNGVGVDVLTI
jgi:hypothetical protein